jgi:recombinational DNA repair protein (RecF pathway)
MPSIAIEKCCKCGKAIDLKQVKTYRVRDDFRLVCKECAEAEKTPPPHIEERKKSTEKKR